MTRDEMFDRCIEMWNEIAEEGYTEKRQSRYVRKYMPRSECFACEYYLDVRGGCTEFCPFAAEFGGCGHQDSPYSEWCNFEDKVHAIAIADLFIEYFYK